jgi:hypothetical protein
MSFFEGLEYEFIEKAVKAGLLKSGDEFEKYEEDAGKTLAKKV